MAIGHKDATPTGYLLSEFCYIIPTTPPPPCGGAAAGDLLMIATAVALLAELRREFEWYQNTNSGYNSIEYSFS